MLELQFEPHSTTATAVLPELCPHKPPGGGAVATAKTLLVRGGISPQQRGLQRSGVAQFEALPKGFQIHLKLTLSHVWFLCNCPGCDQELCTFGTFQGAHTWSFHGMALFPVKLYSQPPLHAPIIDTHMVLQSVIEFEAYRTLRLCSLCCQLGDRFISMGLPAWQRIPQEKLG